MRNVLKSALVAAVAVVALGTGAKAITVTQAFLSGATTDLDVLRDDDRTYLINRTGGATTLDVGDSLRGMFNISSINGFTFGNPGDTSEFTAIFQVEVASKSWDGFHWNYAFAPDPTFGKVLGSGSYAADTPGAMVVLYEDPSNNLNFMDNGGLLNAEPAIATASDGTRYFTLGFNGTAGEAWLTQTTGLASDNLALLHNVNVATTVGTTLIAINRLNNVVTETGDVLTFIPVVDPINGVTGDIVGTINVLGIKQYETTQFDSASNAQLSAQAIPTPASIWGGMMLLGLLGVRQMRRSRAQ